MHVSIWLMISLTICHRRKKNRFYGFGFCNNSSWWSINPIQSDPGGKETLPPTKMSVDILKTSTDTATIAECLKQHPDVAMSKDSNGNIEIVSGRKIFYDYENRPIRIITSEGSESTYVYDHEGNRVIKNVDGVRTTYIGTIYEETSGENIAYIHAGNQRVALKSSKDGVLYFHTDHLGSTSKMTDSSGAVVRETKYNPYGSVFANVGSKDNDHRFTGQRSDDPTGLYYYGARYYDPELGIFLTPDTIVQSPYDPQTLNRYSYCRDNPIIYTDPNGHIAFIPILLAIAKAAAIGGAMNAGIYTVASGGNFTWQGFGQSFAIGAAIGAGAAMGGAVAGQIGLGGTSFWSTVGRGGIAGAFASGAGYSGMTAMNGQAWNGDDFFQTMGVGGVTGAAMAAAGKLLEYGYKKMVRFKPDPKPGEGVVRKGLKGMPVEGKNHFGLQGWEEKIDPNTHLPQTEPKFWDEGGSVSRIFNKVPGVNAVAGMHDAMQVNFGTGFWRDALNFPTMPVAAAVTCPALIAGNFSGAVVTGHYVDEQLGVKK